MTPQLFSSRTRDTKGGPWLIFQALILPEIHRGGLVTFISD